MKKTEKFQFYNSAAESDWPRWTLATFFKYLYFCIYYSLNQKVNPKFTKPGMGKGAISFLSDIDVCRWIALSWRVFSKRALKGRVLSWRALS